MDLGKKIAIIGLGYVGLPLAVEFGKTRKVLGFDINQSRVDELMSGGGQYSRSKLRRFDRCSTSSV